MRKRQSQEQLRQQLAQVQLQLLQSHPNTWWTKVKEWFGFSQTILLARLTAFTGFLIAAIGGLDWGQIYSLDFSHGIASKQNLTIGGIAFLHGLVTEGARRRGGSIDPV